MIRDLTARAPRSFAFGGFLLVPERQALLSGGEPLRIGCRALDILTLLVTRAGQLVTKRELMSQVWPETVVEDSNLKVHVAALRRALGDLPVPARYIATVPGRGYRFVAPVVRLPSILDGAAGPPWPVDAGPAGAVSAVSAIGATGAAEAVEFPGPVELADLAGLTDVSELCRRLDGLARAFELAATRMRRSS